MKITLDRVLVALVGYCVLVTAWILGGGDLSGPVLLGLYGLPIVLLAMGWIPGQVRRFSAGRRPARR